MTKTVGCRPHKGDSSGKGGDKSTEGVVYMMERRGPRTERWETPQETVYKDQKLLLHLTRDDKYDLDQLRTEPCMPNQDERWVSKTNTHLSLIHI